MRLLDTLTGHFVEKDARDHKTRYAILSHTWGSKGEQTYQELRDIQKRYPPNPTSSLPPPKDGSPPTRLPPQPLHCSPPINSVAPDAFTSCLEQSEIALGPIWADSELSSKIRDACAVARANGYRYIWIDSCCIDKTSSSELSESINSMYLWYTRAYVCFTFLADVPAEEDHQRGGSRFRHSRWFTRGWTLQELIAPARVVFFSSEWRLIGSKHSLVSLVTEITNISSDALLHLEPLREFSVAQRLSWASKRETTRVEDQAYSLLGIFDINMSTLYGEGDRAFRRLQEEIMRHIPDQSTARLIDEENPGWLTPEFPACDRGSGLRTLGRTRVFAPGKNGSRCPISTTTFSQTSRD